MLVFPQIVYKIFIFIKNINIIQNIQIKTFEGDAQMKKKVMLKQKLLRVSIILIALFTAAIFFVTNMKVTI